ncbi:MAG: hypothetical protein ACKOHG_15425, partial [Planctomycetia bacterium]
RLPVLPPRTKNIHARLLAALCGADADAAEKLIRHHLACWFEAIAKADVPAERAAVAFRGPSVSLKRRRRAAKA